MTTSTRNPPRPMAPDRHGLSPMHRPAPGGLLALVAIAALMAACEKRPSDPATPKTVAAVTVDAESTTP